MNKNTTRSVAKLNLTAETLRSLTPVELGSVAGGASEDGNCLLCPSRTWSTSKKRTIMY